MAEHPVAPSPIGAERYAEIASFRVALRRFERASDRAAKQCGLTPRRYLMLLLIAARPVDDPATVSTLTRDMALAQSSVTDLVARAVDGGLIVRSTDEADGRVSHLRLTPEAERRLGCAVDRLSDERAELRERLVHLSQMI